MSRKKKETETAKEPVKIEKNDGGDINDICRDCINDCKQKSAVAIISCPQKIKVDEQLMLFNKNGKPRKWR